jgi:uncharacterized membrane protein SpoIIM required for sporulation
MSELKLRSYEFRREREASWHDLEMLVDRVEKSGISSLSASELSRLPLLYRGALSSLSVARSISLDRNVLAYLEGLTGRAYFCVYSTKRPLGETIRDFFARGFPATVREMKWQVAISALFVILGTVAGFVLTHREPDRFYTFVDEAYASGRNPSASTEELREVLYDAQGGFTDQLATLATFLFTHNAQIGLFALALGFVAGVPVFLLLFTNGLLLGAFGALYHGRGLSYDFWAWVMPHGVTELLAVILCGAGGLAMAQALVFPGRHTRLRNLALRGRKVGVIALGAVCMFFVAGLIEGFFRQLVQDPTIRWSVAVATATFWILYLGFAGRRRPT